MRNNAARALGGIALSAALASMAFSEDLSTATDPSPRRPNPTLEARVAPGYDRIEGIRLRAEATLEYGDPGPFSFRVGASTEFASLLPDAVFACASLRAGSGGYVFRAEAAYLLGFLPYSASSVAGFKAMGGFSAPWLEVAAGVAWNSYPGGYSGIDFLAELAFKAAFDSGRLRFSLEFADYGDFMRGSLSSIRIKLEGRYVAGGLEGFADIDCFPAGSLALSSTWSRIMVGFGLRKAL